MKFAKPPKPIRDKRHLHFIASLPCCICLSPFTVAHHLLRTTEKAMGRRSGDDKTIPMCGQHHTVLHATGDETLYLKEAGGIHGPTLALALWEASGNHEDGERIVRCAREQAG